MTGHRGKCTAPVTPDRRLTSFGEVFVYLGLAGGSRLWATLGQVLNPATAPTLRHRYPLAMAVMDHFWRSRGRVTVTDLDMHLAETVPCVDGAVCAGSGYGDHPMRPVRDVPATALARRAPTVPASPAGEPTDLLDLLAAGGGAA